jgi:hypothetical protein
VIDAMIGSADLEDTSECQYQPASGSHQEYGSDVEQESDTSVRNKDERTYAGQLIEGCEALGEREHERVDERANWCVVVKGNEWVHFEPMKKKLDHYEPRSFEL